MMIVMMMMVVMMVMVMVMMAMQIVGQSAGQQLWTRVLDQMCGLCVCGAVTFSAFMLRNVETKYC
jgi:hypothetical protein